MSKKNHKNVSIQQLTIHGIAVELVRKNIKNLNLRIIPPQGKVKVSAPVKMPLNLIYDFVISKCDWITNNQVKMRQYEGSLPSFVDGETHSYFGQQYLLKLIDTNHKSKIVINEKIIELHVGQNATIESRQAVIENWCRLELKQRIPILIDKYERLMDLQVQEFGVKKMKTRWGTCNPRAKRIWLNLELAKKPIECLEYVVLHEMTHFLESKHTQRFYDYVALYMPEWKTAEKKLTAHENEQLSY